MTLLRLVLFCLLASVLSAAESVTAPPPAHAGYTIPNTVTRVLPRTADDRLYKLDIALPASFAEHPERRYPVILVCDGYWGFSGVASVVGGLTYGKHVPESLVVGLSYEGENLDYGKLRNMDLARGAEKFGGEVTDEQHAERYLDLIQKTILPLLEHDYRGDPAHRYIVGSSAGGYFVLYSMFTQPELFQGYVTDSPSIASLWDSERHFTSLGRKVPGRVFVTSAGNEWREYRKWIPLFYERMKQHGYVTGGMMYRETEGVRHSAAVAESYLRGLMYVMDPIAPERGEATDAFVASPGKRSYAVTFWLPRSATDPARIASAKRDHEAFIGTLLADKRVQVELLSTEEIPDSVGTIYLEAATRAEVENLMREDPTVKAKLIEFEVIADGI
ncbi:MAG: alpha/beta hydrolase-fold protein [Opitutus sp.]